MPKPTTTFKTLTWAAYLACSWTWCIGMFLPILLLRDFGPWGFIVFATPNVLGAAAMGFVLTRNKSTDISQSHKPMLAAFALITIAFHIFFLAWMERPATTPDPTQAHPMHWPAILTITIGVGTGLFIRRAWPIVTAAVLIFSATVLAMLIAEGSRPNLHPIESHSPPLASLLPLAPTVVFGFLLCPYLDPTFHRALQESPSRKASFAIGFVIFFLSMIILTTAYATLFLSNEFNLHSLVFIHIAIQSALTIALHIERISSYVRTRPINTVIVSLALLAVFVLARAIGNVEGHDLPAAFASETMTDGELIYRLFLSFYGLVFPAYVYLCMIPTKDAHSGLAGPQGRRKRNTWLATIAIAAPFFWMGFIERRELFLIPGLAIILLARLTLRARKRNP